MSLRFEIQTSLFLLPIFNALLVKSDSIYLTNCKVSLSLFEVLGRPVFISFTYAVLYRNNVASLFNWNHYLIHSTKQFANFSCFSK